MVFFDLTIRIEIMEERQIASAMAIDFGPAIDGEQVITKKRLLERLFIQFLLPELNANMTFDFYQILSREVEIKSEVLRIVFHCTGLTFVFRSRNCIHRFEFSCSISDI